MPKSLAIFFMKKSENQKVEIIFDESDKQDFKEFVKWVLDYRWEQLPNTNFYEFKGGEIKRVGNK